MIGGGVDMGEARIGPVGRWCVGGVEEIIICVLYTRLSSGCTRRGKVGQGVDPTSSSQRLIYALSTPTRSATRYPSSTFSFLVEWRARKPVR